MDRAMLEQHIALAERHVAGAERSVSRQRRIIKRLQRAGLGASETTRLARELLDQMEASLRNDVAERDRLRAQLRG
jgi:hypothetical protein